MAGLTKNGVCYDLRESPYILEMDNFRLHFSSLSHKRKFSRDVHKTVLWLNDSLSRRFHMNVSLRPIAVLNLYRQVETRGFYVHDMWLEKVYERPEDVVVGVVLYAGTSGRDG